jgi:hypothetical protein
MCSRFGIGCLLTIVVATGFGFAAKGPRSLTITYHSDPEGAMLYANDTKQLFGYTPFALKYKQLSPGFKNGSECMRLQPAMVRWASGLEAKIDGLTACPQNGGKQQFVFVRPNGVAGREIDVQVALQLQQQELLKKQARADRIAAIYQAYSVATQQNLQRLQQLRCTSNLVGSFVYTNCSQF